jgi:hypothetical protein
MPPPGTVVSVAPTNTNERAEPNNVESQFTTPMVDTEPRCMVATFWRLAEGIGMGPVMNCTKIEL